MQNFSGTLFIVAAPSGGGKTSLVNDAVKKIPNLEISISHTTRPMRQGEDNGKDYFFISEREFNDMIAQNEFVEYAHVFDYFYATSWGQIENRLKKGMDVILDIDWQGAQQIKNRFKDAISIFIIPPSLESLRERLLARQRDDNKTIENRMHKAQDELEHYKEFDYLIVNDDFSRASADLCSIITASRLTLEKQQKKQTHLLSMLLANK